MKNERYNTIVTFLDNEMSRFWVRFNIFTAIQVGALLGLLAQSNSTINQELLRAMVFMMLVFSIVGLIVIIRGYDLQRAIVLSVFEFENKNKNKDLSLILVRSKTRAPMFINSYACIFFGAFACLMWFIAVLCPRLIIG